MTHAEQQDTATQAIDLAEAIRGAGSLDPVYERLDAAIEEIVASGHRPEDLLPADTEPGIGFSLREKRDGKTLWQAIAYAGRSSICDPASDVRTHLGNASKTGAAALVGAVMATLGLPLMATPIAVSIAAVILAVGISGFCQWSAAAPDEPAAS